MHMEMEMALNKKPKFEAQDSPQESKGSQEAAAAETTQTVASDAQEQSSSASTEQAAPEAKQETQSESTAVATRPAASVSTVVKKQPKYREALVEYKDVIDPQTVEFNTFRRITVGLDGFEDDQKVDLGKEIHLELMSYNDRWVVSPGTQDKEATDHVRYSADGKTIDGTEQTVQEYLDYLKKVEAYDEASVKQYMTVYGFLTYSNGKEIDVIDRSLVAVQVPPQSRAFFDRYRIETGFKVAAGVMEETNHLVLKQEKQQGKTTKYAVIRFSGK